MTREVYPKHAANRCPVILGDGRLGTVVWLYRNTGRAKVKVAGRHVLVPVESLRLATVHRLDGSCCGIGAGGMGERDRMSSDPATVNCPGRSGVVCP